METETASGAPAWSEERLARARRRLAALKGFYVHVVAFTLVLTGLVLINAAVGGPWWVLWVLLGWGIAIIAHGLTLLAQFSRIVADWEERKLKEFLAQR